MSEQNKSNKIVFKKTVYVVQLGTSYVWNTAASTRVECVHKALEYFSVENEEGIVHKGGTIILILTKEIK